MFAFRVGIPSYARIETLQQKTLSYLERCGIAPENIDVFCADQEQTDAYRAALGSKPYTCIKAVPGIGAVRNFMHMHYPVGTRVFSMDDDISAIHLRHTEKYAPPTYDLKTLLRQGFDALSVSGGSIFGISAVLNPFFMRPGVTFSLKFIVGCAFGFVSNRDLRFCVSIDDKEDIERTLLYYLAQGSTCRLNAYAPKTRYYTEPGGMQLDRTEAKNNASARYLLEKYPQLCQVKKSTADGWMELRLRDARTKRGSDVNFALLS